MDEVEVRLLFEGRTVEEAVQAAARHWGVAEDELEFDVLSEGSETSDGAARVKVVQPPSASAAGPEPAAEVTEDALRKVEDVVRSLVSFVGGEATVRARQEGESVLVTVEAADGSQAVRQWFARTELGPVLPSLQLLANKMLNRPTSKVGHIVLVVEGFPRAGVKSSRPRPVGPDGLDPELVELGEFLVDKALRCSRTISIVPMSAGDRRAVHQAVLALEGARTVSTGEGLYRRLHVVPRGSPRR